MSAILLSPPSNQTRETCPKLVETEKRLNLMRELRKLPHLLGVWEALLSDLE
jgi:hypothetical protein